jgi:hypothetical protein
MSTNEFGLLTRAGEPNMVKQLINRPVARLAVLLNGFGFQESRRHPRAKIKWPVVITTPNGLVDGQTQNLSLGGAFIRCPAIPNLEDDFRLVMTAKERLILVTAKVVWSNGSSADGKPTSHVMGIRFTNLSSNDRSFLSGVISGNS